MSLRKVIFNLLFVTTILCHHCSGIDKQLKSIAAFQRRYFNIAPNNATQAFAYEIREGSTQQKSAAESQQVTKEQISQQIQQLSQNIQQRQIGVTQNVQILSHQVPQQNQQQNQQSWQQNQQTQKLSQQNPQNQQLLEQNQQNQLLQLLPQQQNTLPQQNNLLPQQNQEAAQQNHQLTQTLAEWQQQLLKIYAPKQPQQQEQQLQPQPPQPKPVQQTPQPQPQPLQHPLQQPFLFQYTQFTQQAQLQPTERPLTQTTVTQQSNDWCPSLVPATNLDPNLPLRPIYVHMATNEAVPDCSLVMSTSVSTSGVITGVPYEGEPFENTFFTSFSVNDSVVPLATGVKVAPKRAGTTFRAFFEDGSMSDVTVLYEDPKNGNRLQVYCITTANGNTSVEAAISSWNRYYVEPNSVAYMRAVLIANGMQTLEQKLRTINQQICRPPPPPPPETKPTPAPLTFPPLPTYALQSAPSEPQFLVEATDMSSECEKRDKRDETNAGIDFDKFKVLIINSPKLELENELPIKSKYW